MPPARRRNWRTSLTQNRISSGRSWTMGGSEFFVRNGLLFQSTDDVAPDDAGVGQAAPLISTLAGDPSLRGLTRTLVARAGRRAERNGHARRAGAAFDVGIGDIEDALAGRPAAFSWQEMLNGKRAGCGRPAAVHRSAAGVGFFRAGAGPVSSDAIRKAASDLELDSKYQARVRLTGSVPMADEEFATVQQGAFVNTLATIVGRAGHPVAGAEVAAHHRGGIHQPVHWSWRSRPRSAW